VDRRQETVDPIMDGRQETHPGPSPGDPSWTVARRPAVWTTIADPSTAVARSVFNSSIMRTPQRLGGVSAIILMCDKIIIIIIIWSSPIKATAATRPIVCRHETRLPPQHQSFRRQHETCHPPPAQDQSSIISTGRLSPQDW
jgi:hypothetical protein